MSTISEKIEKLIRLSKSSNQHEAELAMQKAKEIAMQNDLDMSQLQVTAEQDIKEEFTKEFIEDRGKKSCIAIYIFDILKKHFKVTTVTARSYKSTEIYFIGRKDDVQSAKYIYNFLDVTFNRLWKEYKKQNNLPTRYKLTYMNGLWKGLLQKLDEIEREALSKNNIDSQNKYAVIVKNEMVLRDEFMNNLFNNIKKTTTRHNLRGDDETYNAGIASGRNININKGLNNSNNNSFLLA